MRSVSRPAIRSRLRDGDVGSERERRITLQAGLELRRLKRDGRRLLARARRSRTL